MAANLKMMHTDLATKATITASSEELTFPIENITTPKRKQAWRTLSGVTTAYITVDFGAAVSVGGCVMLNSNLGATGTYRVRHGSVAAMTSGVLYDSTALTSEGDATYPDHCVWWTNTTARYLRIDLVDATKTYLSIGRMMVGPSWQATVTYGARWSVLDESQMASTRGGIVQRDLLPTKRIVQLPLDYIADASVRSDLLEAIRILGRSRDGAWYLPGNTARMGRDLIVGFPDEPIEAEAFDYLAWRSNLKIREA